MLRHDVEAPWAIVTDRKLEPGDDCRDLIADIKANGLKHPILVDENLRLLDGLRRLQAFKESDKVPVVISDNIPDTMAYLKQVEHQAKPGRVWRLFSDLDEQRARYWVTSRRGRGHGRGGINKKHRSTDTRYLIADAFGVSDHWAQAVLFLYGRNAGYYKCPEELKPLVSELVKEMDQGGNVHSARTAYIKAERDLGRRTPGPTQQRSSLRAAASSLAGIVHALRDIDKLHPSITATEATEWAPLFNAARAEIRRIASVINERASN